MKRWGVDRLWGGFQGSLRAVLVALAAIAGVALWGAEPRAAETETPQSRDYSRVRAAPAPQSQTPEAAQAKSAGCLDCHSASDAPTMHASASVVLGCVDCHGGDASVRLGSGIAPGDVGYGSVRDAAHVLPRYPQSWNYPSSANPQRSYTLLNREAPEYIRFVNPSDYRVARESCGACHLEIIHAAERSPTITAFCPSRPIFSARPIPATASPPRSCRRERPRGL
jgi:hypothetical protein